MIQQMLELMKDADIVFCESDHAETSEQVESVDNVKIECWDQKTQLLYRKTDEFQRSLNILDRTTRHKIKILRLLQR